MNIPILIPHFNSPTYLRQMITQLAQHKLLENVAVLDMASEFEPAIEFLTELQKRGIQVMRKNVNSGPRSVIADFFDAVGQFFVVTDPDIEFNPDLPANFLEVLSAMTERLGVGKAGLALRIDDVTKTERFDHGGAMLTIPEWEGRFWEEQLCTTPDGSPVYKAITDTTFAVYNKRFFRMPGNFLDAVRVGGIYTARHLPWYENTIVPADEAAYYKAHARYSEYRT